MKGTTIRLGRPTFTLSIPPWSVGARLSSVAKTCFEKHTAFLSPDNVQRIDVIPQTAKNSHFVVCIAKCGQIASRFACHAATFHLEVTQRRLGWTTLGSTENIVLKNILLMDGVKVGFRDLCWQIISDCRYLCDSICIFRILHVHLHVHRCAVHGNAWTSLSLSLSSWRRRFSQHLPLILPRLKLEWTDWTARTIAKQNNTRPKCKSLSLKTNKDLRSL